MPTRACIGTEIDAETIAAANQALQGAGFSLAEAIRIMITKTAREEYEQAAAQVDKILAMAENASCLEDQSPSDFLPSLCRKIMTYQKISGSRP